ncbi:MAG TPA: Crp/Fnr family transcriptional regulator [Tenuifilaceae bacterium]|nr:Crp/Fnr family transcriptional regulator [Tenuifilaceae bacterium]HPQ35646.1 Crp/Fnr family transcriptional regulator [Tenuifilaceae bacterium]
MNLEEILLNHFNFSEREIKITMQLYEFEAISARQFFLKEGEVCSKIAIVLSGLLRTFIINEDGDDITTKFHEPQTLILSIKSFNNAVKAKENIVAITDSELLTITSENWNKLLEEVPAWREICLKTGDVMNLQLLKRTQELQTLSAKKRYEKFCKEHPLVYQKATLGHIASYLGIDIATLSRIRKKG